MIFSYHVDSNTDLEGFNDILEEEQQEISKLDISFIYKQY